MPQWNMCHVFLFKDSESSEVCQSVHQDTDSPQQLAQLNLALGLPIMKMEVAQMMPQLLYLTPV